MQSGIDSISVTPDSFFAVKNNVADAEAAKDNGFARQVVVASAN